MYGVLNLNSGKAVLKWYQISIGTKGYYDILSGILPIVSNIKCIHKELYTFSTYLNLFFGAQLHTGLIAYALEY